MVNCLLAEALCVPAFWILGGSLFFVCLSGAVMGGIGFVLFLIRQTYTLFFGAEPNDEEI